MISGAKSTATGVIFCWILHLEMFLNVIRSANIVQESKKDNVGTKIISANNF